LKKILYAGEGLKARREKGEEEVNGKKKLIVDEKRGGSR